MKIQPINTDTYVIAVDNTSKNAAMAHDYGPATKAIFTNLSNQAVFITSGHTAPTAVFPTSSTVPLKGKVIPASTVMTYDLPQGDMFISAIQLTSGTGNLYISIGEGI